jgi:hypothetical protein
MAKLNLCDETKKILGERLVSQMEALPTGPQSRLDLALRNMQKTMELYKEYGCNDTEGHMALQTAMVGALLYGEDAWCPVSADDWGLFTASYGKIELANVAFVLSRAYNRVREVILRDGRDGYVNARVRNYCWRVNIPTLEASVRAHRNAEPCDHPAKHLEAYFRHQTDEIYYVCRKCGKEVSLG